MALCYYMSKNLILFLDDSFLVINLSDYAYVRRKKFINPFMHNVEKWPNLAHTAKFLKYGCRFFNIMHESVIIFGDRFF